MANIVSNIGTVTGTADADLIVVDGSAAFNSIDGGGGSDVIFSDGANTFNDFTGGNSTTETALNIDQANVWSTLEDPDAATNGIPHTKVLAAGTTGATDFFSVTVGVGAALFVDLDYGFGPAGGPAFDAIIQVIGRTSSGGVVSVDTFDDSFPATSNDNGGSFVNPDGFTFDPLAFLVNQTTEPVTYTIQVGRTTDGSDFLPFQGGETYQLNISVEGHAFVNPTHSPDSIDGGAGDDIINSLGGDDSIFGNIGNDTINSGQGNDRVDGGVGADSVSGGAGNDTIEGGAGADSLDGGGGIDTLSFANATASVGVNLGTGVGTGDAAGDTYANFEILEGSAFSDTVVGGIGNDTIIGGAGADTLLGSIGNDTIIGGAGADSLLGGAGIDTVSYANAQEQIFIDFANGATGPGVESGDAFDGFEIVVGSDFNDELRAGGVTLFGGAGNDRLASDNGASDSFGGAGDDLVLVVGLPTAEARTYDGGSDFDILTIQLDFLVGDLRSDIVQNFEQLTLDGQQLGARFLASQANQFGTFTANGISSRTVEIDLGAETLLDLSGATISGFDQAGSGFIINGDGDAETITGTSVSDTILGNGGNDTIQGGAGADSLNGGAGIDTVSYANAQEAINISFVTGATGSGVESGDTFAGFEIVVGSDFNDELRDGGLTLFGEAGNDQFTSENGASDIFGGEGDDLVRVRGTLTSNIKTYDGGVGVDMFSLDLSPGVQDFRSDIVQNFERLSISGNVRFLASQANQFGSFAEFGSTIVEIDMGAETLLDLSGATISGFDQTGSGFIINGDGDGEAIIGSSVSDTILGNGGNDIIIGGAGADSLNGGAGIDTVSYASSTAGVAVDLITMTGSGGGAAGDSVTGFEILIGSAFNDNLAGFIGGAKTLRGGAGNDVLRPNGGMNLVSAGDGNDDIQIQGDFSEDGSTLDGGAGLDTLFFFLGSVGFTQDLRDDALLNLEMLTFSTTDTTEEQRVQLLADQAAQFTTFDAQGTGQARIIEIDMGTAASLDLSGVTVIGFDQAGSGFIINGDGDAETITGTSVADTIEGGAGADSLDGGAGIDTVSYASSTERVVVNLRFNTASGGHAAGDSLSGFENAIGSAFNDGLIGDLNAASTLVGGAGDDVFTPNGGTNLVSGGDGNDEIQILGNFSENGSTLDGGAEEDTLSFSFGTFGFTQDLRDDTLLNIETLSFENTNTAAERRIHLLADQAAQFTAFQASGPGQARIIEIDMGTAASLDLSGVTVTGFDQAGSGFIINGDADAETIIGTSVADTIAGGAGADSLDGGLGIDTVSYSASLEGVTVRLDGTVGVGGDAAGDVISNVENLVGSGFADILTGSSNDNTIDGGDGADVIFLQDGGADSARSGDGNDGIFFGAALDGNDIVDGGAGDGDQLALQGDYSGGLTFGANSAVGIELVVLLPGNITNFGAPGTEFYDYNFTLVDANIGAGQQLAFQANQLRAGEDFTLDASAETDGTIFTFAGLGNESLTGGANDDAFFFGAGRFNPGDRVDGATGQFDSVGLQGDFSAGITIGPDQLTNIDVLAFLSSSDARFGTGTSELFSYNITTDDGNVVAGQSMIVSSNQLTVGENLTFDGSAETDGLYLIFSGNGDDSIAGSQGADTISGGGGSDTLTGNGGNDVFLYANVTDSPLGAADVITDFTAGDLIDVSGIDADMGAAGNQAFTFIGAGTFSSVAGQLRAVNASGNTWTVQADDDGDGMADFEIQVTVSDGDPLTTGDFVL